MSLKNKTEEQKSSKNDEVDYMSDDFVLQCSQQNDIRPGLIGARSTKRKYEIEKKRQSKDEHNRSKNRSVKHIQEEYLKDGLNTKLTSSNKGFAMLQKMGYTPGSSLGKNGTGHLEPIKVELKHDRVGLGWQQMITDVKKRKEEVRSKRFEHKRCFDPDEYRSRKRMELMEKKIKGELRKCQRECYELDCSKQHLETPHEYWFWPPDCQPQDQNDCDEEELVEDEESKVKKTKWTEELKDEETDIIDDHWNDEDIFEPQDQLDIITAYLRDTYNYCIWCGTLYNNLDDLTSNCPGSSRTDHDD